MLILKVSSFVRAKDFDSLTMCWTCARDVPVTAHAPPQTTPTSQQGKKKPRETIGDSTGFRRDFWFTKPLSVGLISGIAPAGWITDILRANPGLRLTEVGRAAQRARAGLSLTPLGAGADIGRAANQRMFANIPDWMKFQMATTEVQGLGEFLGGWFAGLSEEDKLKLRREHEEWSRRNADDDAFHDGFRG